MLESSKRQVEILERVKYLEKQLAEISAQNKDILTKEPTIDNDFVSVNQKLTYLHDQLSQIQQEMRQQAFGSNGQIIPAEITRKDVAEIKSLLQELVTVYREQAILIRTGNDAIQQRLNALERRP
jgi:hypothetical protein